MKFGPTFGLPQGTINAIVQATEGNSNLQTSLYNMAIPILIKFNEVNSSTQAKFPYGYIVDRYFAYNDCGTGADFSMSLVRLSATDFPVAPIVTPSVAASGGGVGNLNATYDNGVAGVGATLTNAGAQAAFTLNGYNGVLDDYFLITDQAATLQNGLYKLTTVGDGATNWVLTRLAGYDTGADLAQFMLTWDTNLSIWFYLIGTGPFTVGVTALTYSNPISFNRGAYANGAGETTDGAALNATFWSDVSINGFFDSTTGFNFAFVPRFTTKNSGPVSAGATINVSLSMQKVL